MAAPLASSKPPYDPVKAVDGMFNGSVIRIASFFKNPSDFGPDTKRVLSETSKRFQDALDDCEIQILEAKWFLEHQLSLNKARREAKALEDGGGVEKRKLNELQSVVHTHEPMDIDESPPKRQKVEEPPPEPVAEAEPAQAVVEPPPEDPAPPTAIETSADDAKPQPVEPKAKIPKPQAATPTPPDPSTQFTAQPSTADGFLKETPHDTPANEAFNFESMFGEPSGGADDNNVNFDFDMDPDSFASNINLDDPSSLNHMLPGVESYANEGGDEAGFNFATDKPTEQVNPPDNDFNLPEMGNAFDSLLDGNDFGGSGDGVDDILNDNSMLDMDSLDRLLG